MNVISHCPLVSVIVPAHNAENFIRQTLNSVLSQTYQNIEVLVVDDGSQDRTAEIVKSIAQKDYRVILLQQPNAGVAAARNLAIQNSSGEYIAPIDADDIWFNQKLEKQVLRMLEANPSVGLVYAWSVSIDENGSVIGIYNAYEFSNIYSLEGAVYTPLVYRNFVGNASVPLIRRTCFEQVGGYNYQLKEHGAQGCEDWDLYLRIAECYQFRVVPEFLIGYRQSIGSMSSNTKSMARSYEMVMANVQRRHPEIPRHIYNWAKGFFYNYLVGMSFHCSDYWNTLIYLCKALEFDSMLLLRPGLYRMLIISLLRTSIKQFIPLVRLRRNSLFWQRLQFNHQIERQIITSFVINKQINKHYKLWKPYDIVLVRRWFQVVHSRKMSS